MCSMKPDAVEKVMISIFNFSSTITSRTDNNTDTEQVIMKTTAIMSDSCQKHIVLSFPYRQMIADFKWIYSDTLFKLR